MRRFVSSAVALCFLTAVTPANPPKPAAKATPTPAETSDAGRPKWQYAQTWSADGFDYPVGKPDGEGYYRSRGFIIGRHCGDDWNGMGGGNSDLGAPVWATANGLVVYARDARMGWGNVVIIRHCYWSGGRWQYVDSLYAHLHQIMVRQGQHVRKGQQVGTIGTNRGMYIAHLHFEIRKNLLIGINQSSYRKDLSNYYRPIDFINANRVLRGGNRRVPVPINTFRLAAQVVDTMGGGAIQPGRLPAPAGPTPRPSNFKVDRFNDQ